MQQVSTTGVPTGQRTRACARPAASPSTAPRDPVAPVPPVASSPAPATPERYDVLGADGAVLQVRVVEPGDQDALMDLFARVSTRTSYQRFLAVSPVAASEYVASLMGRGEDADVDAVLASSCGVVVAVASIHRVSASAAEVALLIDDEHQGEGLGTLLLEDLVARARARGIRELVALTLRSNVQMLEVFRDLGLPLRIEAEGETFGVTVGLEEPSALQEALAHRSAAAARASLERLLRPRSVLVLGGRGHRSDLGQEVLRHLRRSGFAGPVRAVNRFEDERGLETGDSGDQIPPTAADLAVIAVTPGQELAAARSCAHAGVGAMAVLGTGPVGDLSAPAADTLLAGELRRICRGAGIRLVGPGSVGLANTDPAVGLDVSLTPHRLPAGDVTLVGDSAPVISTVLTALRSRGLGVATVLDTGRGADVLACDLLPFAAADPRTRVAVVCLQGVADPRALTWAVTGSGLGVGLPLLLLTTDHHAAPATATPAGNGPARGSHEEDAVDAWCRRTGVTRVASPRELADTAALLVHQPPPQGRRVAILANGDPNGNADADAVRDLCTGYGLLPPDLTQHTDARLRLLLPASASVGAVVDATAAASPEQLRLTLDALAEDPGVDAVVAMLEPRFHLGTSTIQAMLEEVSAGHARTTFIGGLPLRRGRTSRRVPFADAPDGAVRALAHAIDRQPARRRGRFLAEPVGPPLGLSHRLADLVVADARASSPDGGWLPRHEADELLRAYGVEVVPTVGADGPETAADAAQMLPFPVVLTAHLTQQPADPQPVAVVTGLRSPEEVREAARRVRDRLDDDLHVFDLQPQLHQGPCLRVMGDRREGWGPMVGVGTAGAVVSREPGAPATAGPSAGLPDVRPQWALAPVGRVEATELVRAVRMACGRTAPTPWSAVAIERLAALIARVAVLLSAVPEIDDVELGPVVLDGERALVAQARVRLAPPTPRDGAPLLRRMYEGDPALPS